MKRCSTCRSWLPEPFFSVWKNQYGSCVRCCRFRSAARSVSERHKRKRTWIYRPRRYDGNKICTGCREVLPRERFSPLPGGVQAQCRDCRRIKVAIERAG